MREEPEVFSYGLCIFESGENERLEFICSGSLIGVLYFIARRFRSMCPTLFVNSLWTSGLSVECAFRVIEKCTLLKLLLDSSRRIVLPQR